MGDVWWAKNRGLYFSWGHVWIVVKQAVRLLFFLIWGTRSWLTALAKLLAYVMVLMPGWLRMCWYYFTSNFIIRNVEYGKGHMHRNLLDIYLPSTRGFTGKLTLASAQASSQPAVPVVVFFSGGAWIIGYKLWSALIARGFSACGYITIVPDYRNFPQGDMIAMTEDTRAVLLWVNASVRDYGGDSKNVTVCGQSAGAHIVMTTLLRLLDVVRINQQRSRQKSAEAEAEAEGRRSNSLGESSVDYFTPSVKVPRPRPSSSSHYNGDGNDSYTGDQDINDSALSRRYGVDAGGSYDRDDIDEIKYNDEDGEDDVGSGSYTGSVSPLSEMSYSTTHNNDNTGDDDHESEGYIDVQLAEFILASVQNIILVNPPSDLVALETHCHQKGLDSLILRWICRDDLAAFSPTLIIQRFNAEDATRRCLYTGAECRPNGGRGHQQHAQDHSEADAQKTQLTTTLGCRWETEGGVDSGCGVSPINSPSRTQNTNNKKNVYSGMWEKFPAVSIFSSMDDASIPIRQGSTLHHALRQAKFANIIDTNKNQHRVYAKKSHTSLIVEDPLVGDFGLVFDIHRIISRTTKRRRSRCAGPASPGSPGYGAGPGLRLSDSHVDLVLIGFDTSPTNSQFHNTNRRKVLEKLDIDEDELEHEQHELVTHHHHYDEEEEDAVIKHAKENLGGTVHPYLVSIARKMNPF